MDNTVWMYSKQEFLQKLLLFHATGKTRPIIAHIPQNKACSASF